MIEKNRNNTISKSSEIYRVFNSQTPINCFTICHNGKKTFFSDVCSLQSVLNHFKVEKGYLETNINGMQIIFYDATFLPTTGEYSLVQQYLPIGKHSFLSITGKHCLKPNYQVEQNYQVEKHPQVEQYSPVKQHQYSNFSLWWFGKVSITISVVCIVLQTVYKNK
ncbi:hypothetical protein ACTFIU_009521 [Dictyostelium citrinum]